MARRQNPIDPDAGPVQSFAHDLRGLREKAGCPTYRVLARKAGYSAATLSEAARGQRLPTLDVTLAYVGACGGDLPEWQARWHALSRSEASSAGQRSPAGPAASAAAEPERPVPAAPAHHRAQQWSRATVLGPAVAVALGAVVTATLVLPRALGPARSGQPRM